MSHVISSFALHYIIIIALFRAAAGENVTTIKFPTDDGQVVEAIMTPSSDSMKTKSDDNKKKVAFVSCKPGASCETMKMDYTCDHIKSMVMPQEPLMILIHGFGGSMYNSPVCYGVKNAYMNTGAAMNVFMVDWSSLAKAPNYAEAIYGAITVGEVIPQLIHHIVEDCKVVALKDIHLIGFSLGAHAAGHTGKRYYEMYGKKIGRITGLDPAGPSYDGRSPDDRLDPTDAEYVDVIHTNACSVLSGCFGIEDTCGHADYYPNGGKSQPGCKWINVGCHHRRAVDLYMESVQYKGSFRSCCYTHPHHNSDGNYCDGGTYNTMGRYSTAKGGVYCYCKTNKKAKYSLSSDSRTRNGGAKIVPISTAYWIILPFLLNLTIFAEKFH